MRSDHSAEWSFSPEKSSSPLKWAGEGSLSWPIALTSVVDSNSSWPLPVSRLEIQRRLGSSQREEVRGVLKWILLGPPGSTATFFRDLRRSSRWAQNRGHRVRAPHP